MATTLSFLLGLVPTNNARLITAVSLQTLLNALLSSNTTGFLQNDGTGNLSWQPGGGGGGVASVTDDGNGTMNVSPTTGNVTVGLNLAANNTWANQQTFA